jgi:hypothetical protein
MEEEMRKISGILISNAVKKECLETELKAAQQQLQSIVIQGEHVETELRGVIDVLRKDCVDKSSKLKLDIVDMESRVGDLKKEVFMSLGKRLLLQERMKESENNRILGDTNQKLFSAMKDDMKVLNNFVQSCKRNDSMIAALLNKKQDEVYRIYEENQGLKEVIASLETDLASVKEYEDHKNRSIQSLLKEQELDVEFLDQKLKRIKEQLDFIKGNNVQFLDEMQQEKRLMQAIKTILDQ